MSADRKCHKGLRDSSPKYSVKTLSRFKSPKFLHQNFSLQKEMSELILSLGENVYHRRARLLIKKLEVQKYNFSLL